jgi:hypothetical protein
MGEDQIVPAMGGDQTITSGKIDTGLPFRSADLVFDIKGRLDGGYAHCMHLCVLIVLHV